MDEIYNIIDKVQLFEKMYDSMRIVDPVEKLVFEIQGGQLCKKKYECYRLLKKETFCENCISMGAYNKNDAITKIEYSEEKVYMVTAIPILIQDRRFVLELFKDTTDNLYINNKEEGYEMNVISAIQHMNQAAIKDELTGLYNRRYIDERLPIDLSNSQLKNEPLSIIFADLDFFKAINDTYGHIAGDHVIREFADELKKHIRKGLDWVARYGGEEFIICLSNTDIDTARGIAERIRKNVMIKEFLIDNQLINLTGSFGVHTVCDGDKCITVDGIIEMVDKNLYRAKEEGRNRVI